MIVRFEHYTPYIIILELNLTVLKYLTILIIRLLIDYQQNFQYSILNIVI